jgi:hypothetical protein
MGAIALQSLLRASPEWPSLATRATHASHPRDGDHYSDRLLAIRIFLEIPRQYSMPRQKFVEIRPIALGDTG